MSNEEEALVSIIIPVYNGEKFIEESIESCLRQTYRNIEVIVVNDGSTDNTLQIIERIEKENDRVKLISYKNNKGKVHALNQGVACATGSYIAIQAADDVCFESRIIEEVNEMLKHSKCVLVYGDMEVVDGQLGVLQRSFSKGNGINYYAEKQTMHLLKQNFVSGGTILISEMIREKVFPIPNVLKFEDWWISVVASLYGEIHYLDKPLIKYRRHSSNDNNRIVHTKKEMIQQRINITKRNIAYYAQFTKLVEHNDMIEDVDEVLSIIKLSRLRDEMIISSNILERIKLIANFERKRFKYLKGREKIKLQAYMILGKNLLRIKFR